LFLAPLGCATPENVQPPSVNLTNLQLGSPGLLSQALKISVRIGNPNDFDIPLTGLSFNLEVNGQPFAEGLSNESITVPRLGYANLKVDGTASTIGLIMQFMTLGQRDKIDYRLFGRAHVGHLGFKDAVPFERKGSMSILPAPLGHSQGPAGIRMFAPTP
jgi:LEA14-like dessication related protein